MTVTQQSEKGGQYKDLTEEASKRPGGEEATVAARQAESDDINEESSAGPVEKPNDDWEGNKVATEDDR